MEVQVELKLCALLGFMLFLQILLAAEGSVNPPYVATLISKTSVMAQGTNLWWIQQLGVSLTAQR